MGGEIAPAVDDGGEEEVGSGEILEDALGGIIERATEASEITEGGVFAASLGDGALEEVGLEFFGGAGVVGDDGVELLGELESGPIPGIAFFGDYGHGEGEDDGGGGGGGGGMEFDGTGVGGDMGEMLVGEELEDFGVGIDAWLEAAEDFEENLLVVEDGGVGLFGGEEDGVGSGAEGVAWEAEDGA